MSPSVSVRLLLTQSDQRLVELARAGHERAFEALVQRYRRPLLGYCRRLLLPDERAEDALQQGLLQAWLALQNGTEVRDVKPWLYRIVHNAALNMLRRSGYDWAELHEALSGAGAPSEDLDRRIAVRETMAGLAALPEMQREALLRTAVDGSSYQHVAATMGLSEPAVRGLIHRARSTLRAAATALTPSPLLTWALSAGGGDAPLASRLVEAGAGGGSIGLAGILAKAGATALSAGLLVGGIGTLHHQRHDGAARRRPGSAQDGARGTVARSRAGQELAASQSPAGGGPVGASPSAHLHRNVAFEAPRAGRGVHRAARRRPALVPAPASSISRPPGPAGHPGGSVSHPGDSGGTGGGHDTSGGSPDRQQPSSGQPSSGQPSSGAGDSSGGSRDGGSSSGSGSSGGTDGATQSPGSGESGSTSTDGHGQEPSGSSGGGGEVHDSGERSATGDS